MNDKKNTLLFLQAFLPDALSRLMEAYEYFTNVSNPKDLLNKAPEDIKNFLEFQKACKLAFVNIEQMLKFYKWVEEQENKMSPQEIEQKWINKYVGRKTEGDKNEGVNIEQE